MFDHVVAPYIDNETHLRSHGRHVGEILFRSDSDVDAARLHRLFKIRNDGLIADLVRRDNRHDAEVAIALGKVANYLPEFRIRNLRRYGAVSYTHLRAH